MCIVRTTGCIYSKEISRPERKSVPFNQIFDPIFFDLTDDSIKAIALDKAGGPLLERIDLHIQAEPVPLTEWGENRSPIESSATIRERVVKARHIQADRYSDFPGIHCNARMPEQQLENFCGLDTHGRRFLLQRIDLLQLSARTYSRILKVSRTIADLASSPCIKLEHIAEAVSLRCLDRPIEFSRSKKDKDSDHYQTG
jgi:predicted ATPase with chaperone activity